MLFVTLACVVLGMISIAPGLGVPLAFIAFFSWLRTANVARLRAERGMEVSQREKLQLFFRSAGMTAALIVLICVAAGAAFFTACTAMFTVAMPKELFSSPLPFVAVATLALAISAIYAFRRLFRLNRRLWQLDIHQPGGEPATVQRARPVPPAFFYIVAAAAVALVVLSLMWILFRGS